MHAIDTSTAINGQFTDGDPLAGVPATDADADWLNDLQGNILGVLALAGVQPTNGDYTQLGTAIEDLINSAVGAAGSAPVANQVAPYGMPTRAAIPGGGTDLNGLNQSGFYAAPAGTADAPAGAGAGLVIQSGNGAANGDGAQLYVEAASGKAWTRGRSGGNWGGWVSLTPGATSSLEVNGYSWNPQTGELRQWGYIQGNFSEGVVAVPFPVKFDTCFSLSGHVVNTSADIVVGTWIDEVSVAQTSGQVLVNRVSSGSSNIPGFKWEAHGVAAAFALTAGS